MPMPPLTQSVASPRLAPRRSSSCSSVTTRRAPVQPIGCPSAIAPPLTFSRSAAIGTSSQHGEHLHRERFVELDQIEIVEAEADALAQLLDRRDGPMPMMRGSTPALAQPRIFARGFRPRARAVSADARTSAAPPSVIPDEVPAVMMPGCPSTSPNTGGSLRRALERGVAARMLVAIDNARLAAPGRDRATGAISRAK